MGRYQSVFGTVPFLVCVYWWLHTFRRGFNVAVLVGKKLQIARRRFCNGGAQGGAGLQMVYNCGVRMVLNCRASVGLKRGPGACSGRSRFLCACNGSATW